MGTFLLPVHDVEGRSAAVGHVFMHNSISELETCAGRSRVFHKGGSHQACLASQPTKVARQVERVPVEKTRSPMVTTGRLAFPGSLGMKLFGQCSLCPPKKSIQDPPEHRNWGSRC